MKPEFTIAAVLRKQGAPLSLEKLKLPDLQRGQVLVKVLYSTICQSQVNEVMGHKGADPYLPHTLGHEGVGIVVGTGPEVSRLSVQDKVIMTWLKGSGISANPACYLSAHEQINSGPVSTFLTHAIVSEDRLLSISGAPEPELAPLFGCAIPTAYGMLTKDLKIQKNNSLLILGAGGIGLSTLMVAKAIGVKTVCVTDIREESLKRAREFEADLAINAQNPDYKNILAKMCPDGFDIAVEASGHPEVMESALSHVRSFGGRVLIAGNAKQGQTLKIDPYELIRGKTLSGSWGGGCSLEEVSADLIGLYQKGRLPLQKMITHEVSLRNINEGFELMMQGKGGRIRVNHVEGSTCE